MMDISDLQKQLSDENVLAGPEALFRDMMKDVFPELRGDVIAEEVIRTAFRAGWLASASQQKHSQAALVDLYVRAFRNDQLARSAMQTETKQ